MGEGYCGQCIIAPLTLFMLLFLVSGPGGASASSLHSRIFTVMSCLCIAAVWFCEEE